MQTAAMRVAEVPIWIDVHWAGLEGTSDILGRLDTEDRRVISDLSNNFLIGELPATRPAGRTLDRFTLPAP
ncbi:MAG: hypothetical protein ACJ8GV_00140 [Luteimonas sp.]